MRCFAVLVAIMTVMIMYERKVDKDCEVGYGVKIWQAFGNLVRDTLAACFFTLLLFIILDHLLDRCRAFINLSINRQKTVSE